MQTVGVVFSLLSIGISYVISRDFFKNPVQRTLLEATMCGAGFLLFQSAISQVVNDGVEYLISSWGTNEEKDALEIFRKYQYMADSIERLAPKDFNDYFLPLLSRRVAQALSQNEQVYTPQDLEQGKVQHNNGECAQLSSWSGSESFEDGVINPIYSEG